MGWDVIGREGGRDRTGSHLSKTRNTYARKIDDVLVGVLMTREMDVRTETLYILRGGKNIMYYTLLRRATPTLSYTLREVLRDGRAARTTNQSLLLLEFFRKKCVTSCKSYKKGCSVRVCKRLKMSNA